MEEITLSDMIGKIILIGITYYTVSDEFIEQKQYWGTVVEANDVRISVKLIDGTTFDLPPDLSSTKKAPPGEYRLCSTGEIIIDPDYLTTWIVNRPQENL